MADLKVVTGEVRLSFVHLLEPHTMDEDKPGAYSCTLLIPNEDTRTLNAIKAAQKAALEAGKDTKFNGKVPNSWKNTLRDGDEMDPDTYAGYAGHQFIAVRNSRKPGIVDADLNPIMDASEVYSGMYANVSITAFAYNTSGNKGVSFSINNVRKTRDGEPFGAARTSAADDFADLVDSLI